MYIVIQIILFLKFSLVKGVQGNHDKTYNMTIGMTNLTLPAQETYSPCRYFNITKMISERTGEATSSLYHAIAFKPQVGDIKKMHHMVILGCQNHSMFNYTEDLTVPI
jgi:hypothetical protein